MADHLTEEEQIAALKDWCKRYWKSVLIPVVAVAGGYYSLNVWEDMQADKAAIGGEQYSALIDTMKIAPGAELSDDKRSDATVLATKLVQDHEGTLYSDNANLILARLSMDAKDLSAAEGYLQRVVDDGANNAVQELATSRLARVKSALGDLDGALSLVSSTGGSEYASLFAEIRGDVLAAQGKTDAAKTAFQEAIDGLTPQEYQRRSILQIKLDGADLVAGSLQAAAVTTEIEAVVEESADLEEAEAPVTSEAPATSDAAEETAENS